MIDCHVHFIDASRFRYPIFPQRSAGFEALVGDYSALPRRYLPATIWRMQLDCTSTGRCGPSSCPARRSKNYTGRNLWQMRAASRPA
jgi:hypothetical protein